MRGQVTHIHVIPDGGGAPEQRSAVEAVEHNGLRGDRYFSDAGTFADIDGGGLTLIEAEALAAVERDYGIDIAPGEHRRNITTTGIALNHLVGERFQVGEATCLGTELCEPCSYLEEQVGVDGVRAALVHRGGLRCDIVESGEIQVGDEVEPARSVEEP